MTVSYDFFSIAPFPVLITDGNGTVIYRNRHAARYLPKIRRKMKIQRYLTDCSADIMSGGFRCAEFSSVSPFFRAIVKKIKTDEGVAVAFYLPSRLQFDDHCEIEKFFYDHFGDDPFDFIAAIDDLPDEKFPARLYGELTVFMAKYYDDLSFRREVCDIESLLRPLLAKLNRAFCAIGLRISFDIAPVVHDNRFCRIRPFDSVFGICRIVYAAARCSSTGQIHIGVTYSEKTNSIIVDTETKSDVTVKCGDIVELAPECVFESILISKSSNLKKRYLISKDERGYVHFCSISPCVSSSTILSLRNTYLKISVSDVLIRENVSEIVSMIKKHK